MSAGCASVLRERCNPLGVFDKKIFTHILAFQVHLRHPFFICLLPTFQELYSSFLSLSRHPFYWGFLSRLHLSRFRLSATTNTAFFSSYSPFLLISFLSFATSRHLNFWNLFPLSFFLSFSFSFFFFKLVHFLRILYTHIYSQYTNLVFS